jgi:hydroxymethyl cephem carbamoyltransferase
MIVLALNPGHDGAIAAIKDRALLFSLESEKDSYPRFARMTASTLLGAVERLGDMPDVVAFCGGFKAGVGVLDRRH